MNWVTVRQYLVRQFERDVTTGHDSGAREALEAFNRISVARPRREEDDVTAFNMKFGFLVGEKPRHLTLRKLEERHRFIGEELSEFYRAMHEQDLAEMADALVDIVYVAKGTAVMMGLPWHHHWAEVQRANMAKERGVTKRGNKADCVKPPGWVPPDHETVLARAGYEARDGEVLYDDPEHLGGQPTSTPLLTDK